VHVFAGFFAVYLSERVVRDSLSFSFPWKSFPPLVRRSFPKSGFILVSVPSWPFNGELFLKTMEALVDLADV